MRTSWSSTCPRYSYTPATCTFQAEPRARKLHLYPTRALRKGAPSQAGLQKESQLALVLLNQSRRQQSKYTSRQRKEQSGRARLAPTPRDENDARAPQYVSSHTREA